MRRPATGGSRLVSGIAWLVISLVILQFDAASVTTVGVLVGFMFAFAAIQSFALTSVGGATRWVSAIFGVRFLVSAVICFASSDGTFAALADILGFLFLLVGLWWMVRPFLERPLNPLWWLGLIGGVLAPRAARSDDRRGARQVGRVILAITVEQVTAATYIEAVATAE